MSDLRPCQGDMWERFDTDPELVNVESCDNCWHAATETDPCYTPGFSDPLLYGKCLGPLGDAFAVFGIYFKSQPQPDAFGLLHEPAHRPETNSRPAKSKRVQS